MYKLTIQIAGIDPQVLLCDWQWLLVVPHQVLSVTAMGDAFLLTPTDEVVFLDTLEGKLVSVASCREDFFSLLKNGAYDPNWFLSDMLAILYAKYGPLPQGHCFSFKLPPVVGGSVDFLNVEPTDLVVHFSISGQLHSQIKDIPEGTFISRFVAVEDSSETAPLDKAETEGDNNL